MEALKALPREELERLSAAADVLERVKLGKSSAS
jgi:predicted DNA-binding protein